MVIVVPCILSGGKVLRTCWYEQRRNVHDRHSAFQTLFASWSCALLVSTRGIQSRRDWRKERWRAGRANRDHRWCRRHGFRTEASAKNTEANAEILGNRKAAFVAAETEETGGVLLEGKEAETAAEAEADVNASVNHTNIVAVFADVDTVMG